MHRIINFGLLFSFLTLAISGVLSFFKPFHLATTRVHIVFGFVTVILVGCHLATRIRYFQKALMPAKKNPPAGIQLVTISGTWLLLLMGSLQDWFPAKAFIALGYESRHRSAIVRSSPLAGFESIDSQSRLIARDAGDGGDVSVSLTIQWPKSSISPPSLAIWAETSSGSMIETLYLDPALAYTETPQWGGQATVRHDIFPIWRHRYTLVSGVDPQGQVDAITGATRNHGFTLEKYLVLGEESSFVLCVEVNTPGDPNENYPDTHKGQPSLLYTAYIAPDQNQRYVLLELTGHGGGAEQGGAIHYDLETVTTALERVDFLMAHVNHRQTPP